MRKFLVALFFVALSACEIPEQVKTMSEDQSKELPELATELRTEAALISSCELDSDCIVTGLTPRTCGGYNEYLSISQKSDNEGQITSDAPSTDYLLLNARIKAYRARVRDYNLKNGVVSTCDILEAPRARCNTDKKCSMEAVKNPYADIDAN